MSRIVTVRPVGTVIANAGSNWKVDGGATVFATAHLPKLGDELSSTYANTSVGGADLDIEFDTYTKLVNERFRRVRLRMREGHLVGPGKAWIRHGSGGVVNESLLNTNTGGSSVKMWTGPWLYNNGSGTEFVQADVDILRVKIRSAPTYGSQVNEVYLDIEVQSQPVANVPPPVEANGFANILPNIAWSLADPSDTQIKAVVKIFTIAQAGIGGFDPETSPNTYAYTVNGSYTSHQVSVPLLYGQQYVAYVKPTTAFNGVGGVSDYEGTWSSGTFFTTHTQPTTTVTGPADPVTNTDQPTVTWSVSDPNSDTLGAWVVKVFSAAQYGAVGFTPEGSTALFEAASGSTTTPAIKIGQKLVNGTTYRAYVKTTSKNYKVPSAWAYKQFTMTLTQPGVPIFTAAANLANGYTELTFRTTANLLTPAEADGEAAGPTWVGTLNASVVLDVTGNKQRLVPVATGNARIAIPRTIPIGVGVAVYARAEASKFAGTDRVGGLDIEWYDINGVLLSTSAGSTATIGAAVSNLTVSATSPANTVSMRLVFKVNSPTTSDQFGVDQALIGTNGVMAWQQGFGPLTTTIERSNNGGWSWETVRNFPSGAAAAGVIYDAEAAFVGNVQYRAFSTSPITGSDISSNNASTQTVALPIKTVWLGDPLDPTTSKHFYVADGWRSPSRYKARQVHKPLGSEYAKVIRGEGDYEVFSMNFVLLGQIDNLYFELLLQRNSTLLLRSPKGNVYVEVAGDWTKEESIWDDLRGEGTPVFKVSVPFIEVDVP
jgi:hypothetical protein